MDKLQELLTITMEECAEVSVECSKIIRFGSAPDKLTKEIGDLYQMMELLVAYGLCDWDAIKRHAGEKREKLKTWSSLLEGL